MAGASVEKQRGVQWEESHCEKRRRKWLVVNGAAIQLAAVIRKLAGWPMRQRAGPAGGYAVWLWLKTQSANEALQLAETVKASESYLFFAFLFTSRGRLRNLSMWQPNHKWSSCVAIPAK